MPEFSAAMPKFFNTGNTQWDGNLNAAAGGLVNIFGDPAAQAHAGYYGAETAQALVKSYQLRDQMAEQRRLQDLMAGNGPIVGPAAPGGPPTPPGATPVIPYTSPTPAPSLATTVAPGAPPSPPNPAAAPTPGVGTDGGPTRPDAPPPLAGGEGTTRAPPAQANGQPVSPQMSLPYLMVTAARAGIDPNVVKLLGTSWINEQMRLGKMDAATGNRFLSGAGDPTPLTSATQITTTGMTTQAQRDVAGIQSRATLALPGVQTAATQTLEDEKPLVVIAPDGTRIPTKVGIWRQNPAMGRPENQYDQQPTTIQPPTPPGGPTPPPAMTSTGQAMGTGAPGTGAQPYEAAQAQHDKNNISIVTPQGTVISTTEGDLRANPGLGRKYDPQVDGALVGSVDPATGHTIWRLAMNASGTRVAPATTDQGNAQAVVRAAELGEQGSPLADTVLGEYQRAQLGLAPRQMINPDQHARMKLESDAHFQSLYPVPSGPHLFTSTGPVRPSNDTQALHDDITRSLETTSYKTDPAAAAVKAWDMMREAGIMDDPATARSVGVRHLGTEDPRRTNEGELIINSDMSKVGNLKWPGGLGPRAAPPGFNPPGAKSLTDTVAPKQAGPRAGAMPQGALGPAPSGAAEGTTLRLKDGSGRMGKVQGGWVVPVQGGVPAGAGAGG